MYYVHTFGETERFGPQLCQTLNQTSSINASEKHYVTFGKGDNSVSRYKGHM